jgi:hypothetical protein
MNTSLIASIMRPPALAVAAVVAATATAGSAQTHAYEPNVLMLAQATVGLPELPPVMPPLISPAASDVLAFAATEMGGAKVVKGAPYCADAMNEFTHMLTDGTRISRKTTSRLCRDSEGRTRQEMRRSTPQGVITRVYIHDPVARQMWLLNPEDKSATRLPVSNITARLSGMAPPNPEDIKGWQEYAKRMREWARGMIRRLQSGDGEGASPMPQSSRSGSDQPRIEPVIISEVQKGASSASEAGRVERRVEVLRMGDSAVWGMHGAPGVPAFGAGGMQRPLGPGTVTSLGSKDIDGVRADGTRTTWTIEAGKIGNDKPISITREEWKSPELMVTLQSRYVDPRSGEQSYKLSGISRANPSAELFKPPADFAVRETLWRMAPMPPLPPAPPAVPQTAPVAPSKG